MGHLIHTINDFLNTVLGDVETKFYPHHFEYTEPSMEVTIRWGKRWLEVLGCGMIHPEVLKNMNIDPIEYSGFAFGFGADRLAMLKYGITDVRHLYHPDLRLINQF